MSLIVNELSQILYRILVISPTQKDLRAFFENLSFDLTTHKKLESKKLDMAGAALKGQSVQTWLSFTLGRRSNLNLRVSLAGFAADQWLPSQQLTSFSDGVLLHVPQDNAGIDRILSMKLTQDLRQTPLLCTGIDQLPDDLRKRALLEWVKRNFSKYLALKPTDSFLNEGLEWYLVHG